MVTVYPPNPTTVDPRGDNIRSDLALFILMFFTAILISLKLSITYLFTTPLIILCLVKYRAEILEQLKPDSIFGMFLIFCSIAMVSSLFGFDVPRSLRKLVPFAACGLLIPCTVIFLKRFELSSLLIPLIAGQVITASSSLLTRIFLGFSPEIFHGQVTQAGQLGLMVPFVIGVYGQQIILSNTLLSLNLASSLAIAAAALSSHWTKWLALCSGIFMQWKLRVPMIAITIVTAALLSNLKRGPWLGVAVALAVLLYKIRPKFLLPLACLALLTVGGIAPLRERALQTREDFFIAGGRSTMWEIGAELASRYPLGIGFGNSRVLREFSSEIPEQHRHFHNNALNLLVETGWISTLFFFFWVIQTIRILLRQSSPVCLSVAASLISWQVAGIGEYNVGDSEIMLFAYLLIGIGIHQAAASRGSLL